MKTKQIIILVMFATLLFMNKSVANTLDIDSFSKKSYISNKSILIKTDTLQGTQISFIGGNKGKGGNHAPVGLGYVSVVDSYFKIYEFEDQLLFENVQNVVQVVPFIIEDENRNIVIETSIYLPENSFNVFDISSLEKEKLYFIKVYLNGTYYHGHFYKD